MSSDVRHFAAEAAVALSALELYAEAFEAIGALDKVVERMRMHGRSVQVVGLNEASADLVDRHGATDRTGVEIGLAPHP